LKTQCNYAEGASSAKIPLLTAMEKNKTYVIKNVMSNGTGIGTLDALLIYR
jgi:hypothetical protein